MANNNQSWLYNKEQEQTYRPTLVFDIQLTPDLTINVTTPFSGQGGNPTDLIFRGSSYGPAVANQNIGALQSSAGLGIDNYGSISIDLSDADGHWFNYQNLYSFAGAKMTAYFILYDPETNTVSPDWKLLFSGTCDAASYAENLTTISAISDYNLTKQTFPPMPIQRLCPLDFPETFAQRQAGATDYLSRFYFCGYNPDAPGSRFGNVSGNGQPFTSCNKSKANCVERGMYQIDNARRVTGHFAGSQWPPPGTWKGGSYTQGKTLQGVNCENLLKYSQYVPITYGTTWVTGVAADCVGDPNSTRGAIILGYSFYDYASNWEAGISTVVVNGLKTPYATRTSDLLFRWYGVSQGAQNGGAIQGVIYEGKGDPFGNILCINPIVYQAVANSANPLDVKALLKARPIPVFRTDASWNLERTDTVAWTVFDIIRLAAPQLSSKINLQSVVEYDYVCGSTIPYHRIDGTPSVRGRFRVALTVSKETSVAQLIEGLKLSGRLMIVPNADGTQLLFVCRQGIADQQGSPVPGSNDNTPYGSWRRTDPHTGPPLGIGYSAYSFDETTILAGSMRTIPPPTQSLPTIITCNIQDEDNNWTPDVVAVGNVRAYDKIGRNNRTTLQCIGVPNYDQAYSAANFKFAELWNGNRRGDYGGTERISFQTGFRGMHLTLGALIRVSHNKLNLVPTQWYRIENLSPTRDCSRLTITASWHEDIWSCDSFSPR